VLCCVRTATRRSAAILQVSINIVGQSFLYSLAVNVCNTATVVELS
jgi:hypothetical protein